MKRPNLSIVLTTFNDASFLGEAIESILNQTYVNYEFIVIDDSSTDTTPDVIRHYENQDSRIKSIVNTKNLGVSASRNLGTRSAQGKFIGVMDGDDVAWPTRFETQLSYMEQLNLDLCGSWIHTIPNNHTYLYPVDGIEIKHQISFAPCFCHPSVVYKKSLVADVPYRTEYTSAVDLGLWVDLISLKPDAAIGNIPETLLDYRIHESQMTSINSGEQWHNAYEIIQNYLSTLAPEANCEDIFNLVDVVYGCKNCTPGKLEKIGKTLGIIRNKLDAKFGTSDVLEKLFEKACNRCMN